MTVPDRATDPAGEDIGGRLQRLSAAGRARLATLLDAEPPPALRQELVACVAAAPGSTTDPAALRSALAVNLPDYMVPRQIVVVEKIARGAGGKVDRAALRAAAQTAIAPTPAEQRQNQAADPAAAAALSEIWADVLGVTEIGIHDNFFEVGGDSLLSIRILARAAKAGINLEPEQFFAAPTIAEQAALATAQAPAVTVSTTVAGDAPLTPIQHWFFTHITAAPEHWNQSFLLSLARDTTLEALERALQQLLQQHAALRLRFPLVNGERRQEFVPLGAALPLTVITAGADPAAAVMAAAAQANAGFDLAAGPLFTLTLVTGEAEPALVVVAHHLLVDAMSWSIVFDDLDTLLAQLASGEAMKLPPPTTDFKTWSQRLDEFSRTPALQEELPLWTPPGLSDLLPLPVDFPVDTATNHEHNGATYVQVLPAERTAHLLHETTRETAAQVDEILIAALTRAICAWAGSQQLWLDVEGHGRERLFESIDVSRTVGWFTSVYPVLLQNRDDMQTTLREAKESLRALPRRGIGHGLLRYQGDGAQQALRAAPAPQVCFNYLGQMDKPAGNSLQVVRALPEVSRADACPRAFVLELNARIEAGELVAEWRYGSELHRRSTIAALAAAFADALDALDEADVDATAPSDFPLADLDSDELARLSSLLDGDD